MSQTPPKLVHVMRVYLDEWPAGEVRETDYKFSSGQYRAAAAEGLLIDKSSKHANHWQSRAKFERTAKKVKVGKSPKVPRLGPLQKQALHELAVAELQGLDPWQSRRTVTNGSVMGRLRELEYIDPESHVSGPLRNQFLEGAAGEVMKLEATTNERLKMEQALHRLWQLRPDVVAGGEVVQKVIDRAQAYFQATKEYADRVKEHALALAAVPTPTREQILARLVEYQLTGKAA